MILLVLLILWLSGVRSNCEVRNYLVQTVEIIRFDLKISLFRIIEFCELFKNSDILLSYVFGTVLMILDSIIKVCIFWNDM